MSSPDTPPPDAARPTWVRRALRRTVRRPVAWYRAPWTTERIVQYLTALVLVGGSTLAMFKVVHLDLVLQNNTPTGGDMGAHVIAPAYLRDEFLRNFQLSGWSPDWYAGFPLYRFYMVIPALMIVALNIVLPYGIAFKLVVIAGLVTLPVCCWAFGRLARFAYPLPELFALAGLIFLLDESFAIYGGNVKSTMAGEFSFSIALSFAVLGLGLFARGLETGRHRVWAAVLIALAMLSHGIVLLFVIGAAVLLWLMWVDRKRLVYGVTVLGAAVLLSAFWVLPFLMNHAYMTDMKYEARPSGTNDSFWKMFFPGSPLMDYVVSGFAFVGIVDSVKRRHVNGAWLGVTCVALFAATYIARDSLPLIGLLWNPRVLPFLYLVRYLLMMIGIVATGRWLLHRWPAWASGVSIAAVTAVVVSIGMLFSFRAMPGGHYATKNGKTVYAWGIGGVDLITLSPSAKQAQSDGWAAYNFKGYEGRAEYGEYYALVNTMADLGRDPAHGCGRAEWENNEAVGRYGTTMALMLLPFWTDSCIGSMEGVFFEASGTTPYHFLTAAAVSSASSNPVRQLRYQNLAANKVLEYNQALGVRYVMVFTDQAKSQAARTDGLELVARSGPWEIYEVANTAIVAPLRTEPVVVRKRPGDQRERYLELGTSWFQNQAAWPAMPAADGPASWQRIDVDVDESRRQDQPRQVDVVVPRQEIEVRELPEVTVSNVVMDRQKLSFSVDQIGVPVEVKISYFPNWTAHGADGPYRIGPNMMVVIPRSTEVSMSFERSGVDYLAYVLTLVGIALLVVFRVRGDVAVEPLGVVRAPRRSGRPPEPDEPDPLDPPTAGEDHGASGTGMGDEVPTDAWSALGADGAGSGDAASGDAASGPLAGDVRGVFWQGDDGAVDPFGALVELPPPAAPDAGADDPTGSV